MIPHFASAGGNNSNYFYALYRILTKLRELFNIKQKVELLEEKIRKNFYYWLDLCSRKIKNNVTFDGDIVIIIEGIEHFKDYDTQMESNLKFWLPRIFPDRVRFIITVDHKSNSHKYLTGIGCEVIHMNVEKKLYFEMIQSMKARSSFVSKDHHKRCYDAIENEYNNDEIDNTLYIKSFCSAFVPYETKNI